MHRELTGESVHLARYGADRELPVDRPLADAMNAVRTLARLGRAAREEAGIKVRQPLSRLVCVAPGVREDALTPLLPLLADELNVKQVEIARSGDALVTLEAKANFRSLGKKFGKGTPLAARAVQAFTSDELRRFEHGEALAVSVDGETHQLDTDDLQILRRASGDLVVQEEGGFFAAVDPAVTAELRREGQARELISRVQRMRKEAGLAVSDRIVLTVAGSADVHAITREHGDWIAGEVLATELRTMPELSGDHLATQSVELDGFVAHVAITRTA
jgi:isoleucyl-tRNA synthetase